MSPFLRERDDAPDTGFRLRLARQDSAPACGQVCAVTHRAWPCHLPQGHDGAHVSMLAEVNRAIAWRMPCRTCDPQPATTARHGLFFSAILCDACAARAAYVGETAAVTHA